MVPPSSVSNSLDTADWELIANTLMSMESGVEARCAKTRKLRAELGVMRILIYEHIRGWNGNTTIDGSFFIGAFKSIQRMEREFESLGIKKTEFLFFLELLMKRFERQKLVVKKPLATLSEFKRMKGVVENGPEHL